MPDRHVDSPEGARIRRRPLGTPEWLGVAGILLTVVAVHVGSLRSPFFADDYFFLEQVRGTSLASALASPDPLGNFLRPVSRQLYFWVLTRLGGESPTLFHAAGLVVFLTGLVVLYLLVRRLFGRAAALVAMAFVALHYSADVPLRWASGSQDLLAALFATLAIYLHVVGRRVLSAVALLLGLLSKEVVAGVAIVAMVAARPPGGRWRDTVRQGSGLLAVTAVWGLAWVLSLGARPASTGMLSLHAGNVAAAILHLVQVALGGEIRQGGDAFGHWRALSLLTGLLAGLIIWLASGGEAPPEIQAGGKRRSPSRALGLGLVWGLVAIVPVVLVAPIWSAYFYLWALFGIAVALGGLLAGLARAPRAAVLGALTLLSINAGHLDEYSVSGGAWSWQSHVNGHYLDRALGTIRDYLAEMRVARPSLPPKSTVFFGNVPNFAGWQAGNGPLLRWAYRDTTLRSYFFTQFTRERAERGPIFFFVVRDSVLRDQTADPQLLPWLGFSMLVAQQPSGAEYALDRAITQTPDRQELRYWRGLARWAAGDTADAKEDLRKAGMEPARVLPENADRLVSRAGMDTVALLRVLTTLRARAGLNPWVHGRLAAVLASKGEVDPGVVEAYAYYLLAPAEPDAWRRWAAAQLTKRQYAGALETLEHYLTLCTTQGRSDAEAQHAAESLRRLLHGELAYRALRNGAPR